MDLKLTQLTIQGFKSFGKEQQVRFGDITVFIGANGSGKSNLMSFFEMLEWMMNKKLMTYVALHSGTSFFTHLGASVLINADLRFRTTSTELVYGFLLQPTNDESFIVSQESVSNDDKSFTVSLESVSKKKFGVPSPDFQFFGLDVEKGREAGLSSFVSSKQKDHVNANEVLSILKKCSFFQFHNTSSDAPIRKSGYVNNTGYLMSNGGNLAAFLYGLQQSSFKEYYERIIENIRLAYPSFDDFVLTLNQFNTDNIRLDWRDKDCPPNFRFSPQQLSDGTLRFMALTALLLQPPETIPKVIVIDEPELGLHPSALSLLANMIYTAAPYCQIVLATQSAELLDYFEPEHIRVVEREGGNSIVSEPSEEDLKYWLEKYSLGQIWEKNIIGGRP